MPQLMTASCPGVARLACPVNAALHGWVPGRGGRSVEGFSMERLWVRGGVRGVMSARHSSAKIDSRGCDAKLNSSHYHESTGDRGLTVRTEN